MIDRRHPVRPRMPRLARASLNATTCHCAHRTRYSPNRVRGGEPDERREGGGLIDDGARTGVARVPTPGLGDRLHRRTDRSPRPRAPRAEVSAPNDSREHRASGAQSPRFQLPAARASDEVVAPTARFQFPDAVDIARFQLPSATDLAHSQWTTRGFSSRGRGSGSRRCEQHGVSAPKNRGARRLARFCLPNPEVSAPTTRSHAPAERGFSSRSRG